MVAVVLFKAWLAESLIKSLYLKEYLIYLSDVHVSTTHAQCGLCFVDLWCGAFRLQCDVHMNSNSRCTEYMTLYEYCRVTSLSLSLPSSSMQKLRDREPERLPLCKTWYTHTQSCFIHFPGIDIEIVVHLQMGYLMYMYMYMPKRWHSRGCWGDLTTVQVNQFFMKMHSNTYLHGSCF